jgi:CRISPR-associated protein Cas8b1/Cst1 subtype I-B
MKTKLLLIAGICLFCGAFSMKAQDTVIVKEGDLTYIKTGNSIEKYETKDLKRHYYQEANLDKNLSKEVSVNNIYILFGFMR